MADLHESRLALITVLASQAPGGYIGRTALMKYMYFLQVLRGVPLGYRFTLYSYGPFDSDVLADLGSAEALSTVKSELERYSGGYWYKIRPDDHADWIRERAASFLAKYQTDVNWVVEKFGGLGSAELELDSTIIYADREALDRREKIDLPEVAKRVHEIKPHFSQEQVQSHASRLVEEGLLKAVA